MYNPICDNYVSKCNHDLVYIHTRQAETMSGCCGNRPATFGIPQNQKHHRFVSSCQFYNKLQQTCQFHQVATSLLKSGLLQFVICRLVTTC